MKKDDYRRKILHILLLVYVALCMIFFCAMYEEAIYESRDVEVNVGSDATYSISKGTIIKQPVTLDCDYLKSIGVFVGTYGRRNKGHITVSLENNGEIIASKKINTARIEDNTYVDLRVNKKTQEGAYILSIESLDADELNSIALYYDKNANEKFLVNEQSISGMLRMQYSSGTYSFWGRNIYLGLIGAAVAFAGICIISYRRLCLGKSDILNRSYCQIEKYAFLIKQLVQRDYKAKYMRSVLGLIWSLLYPVLMMAVQYVVFSTLFKTNIKYYPVYLLSANAMFTFFSNSVSAGLTSIVNNASLITKVYVPKYLYPMTKILSTSIDLFLSLIPLTIVVLLTGAPISKAWLMIPFAFILLMIFSSGMAFLLATINVFFRDTQFLWGLATTIWMYATPLFYPETAIPEKFRFLFNLNPMYHYISLFRGILMNGYAPSIKELAICVFFSIVVYYLGIVAFKKNEGKFVLYI